ncbi:MAG: site-specific integrase [Planctomycetaceae bacterium]|jgi:integrase|nr:site-specific integrase [Planctomycetaceae bacterium]
MKISEFVYVPTYLTKASEETLRSYRISINKLVKLFDDPTIFEVNLYGTEFVKKLEEKGLEPATIHKHCRELNAIFTKLGPAGPKNRDAKNLLNYYPYFSPPDFELKAPPEFSDEEFQSLFNAFSNETEFPIYLPQEKRPLFWQAIMVFVSIVAVRREAVLGIEWRDINRQEMYVKIRSEIDKKSKNRYKPIKTELIEYLEQIRPHNISWNSSEKIFEWVHCNKTWYKCWHKAEETAGIKMGLHDIKRFSGELALLAGADVLQLQAHMDHEDINTTLKHYCRPKTQNMVNKIVVPIPKNETVTPPPELEPEELPKVHIAPAFQFHSKSEIIQFYLNETNRLEKSDIIVRTPGGTVLTILKLEEENENIMLQDRIE